MAKTKKYLKVCICILSTLLVILIGVAGNFASNLTNNWYNSNNFGPLPPLTEQILPLFELNNNNFIVALTPFIILFLFLGICLLLSKEIEKLFWYLWLITALLLGIFLSIVVTALILPYVILLTKLNEDTNSTIQLFRFFNLILLIVLTTFSIYLGFKKIKYSKKNNETT